MVGSFPLVKIGGSGIFIACLVRLRESSSLGGAFERGRRRISKRVGCWLGASGHG